MLKRNLLLAFCAFMFVVVVAALPVHAGLITNGDFETGDLSGWTTFKTSSNSALTETDGDPTVVLFDTNGDGASSNSARFRVGTLENDGEFHGGGIVQDVFLNPGTYLLEADVASQNVMNFSKVGGAGNLSLLFNGETVDTFSPPTPALSTQRTTLSAELIVDQAGTYSVGVQFTRQFVTNTSTPIQYADNVTLTNTTAVPEPSSLALVAFGLCSLLGYGVRRRRNLRATCSGVSQLTA